MPGKRKKPDSVSKEEIEEKKRINEAIDFYNENMKYVKVEGHGDLHEGFKYTVNKMFDLLEIFIREDNVNILKYFITNDNVNIQASYFLSRKKKVPCPVGGETVLYNAVLYGSVEIIKYLLSLPSLNLNIRHCVTGSTALDLVQDVIYEERKIIMDMILERMRKDKGIVTLSELLTKNLEAFPSVDSSADKIYVSLQVMDMYHTERDLHMTITTPCDYRKLDLNLISICLDEVEKELGETSFKLQITGIDMFGDDNSIPVLLVKLEPKLDELLRKFHDRCKAEDSKFGLNFHVSVKDYPDMIGKIDAHLRVVGIRAKRLKTKEPFYFYKLK